MKNFWAFLFFRALVGVGEASYSTIAPAIISDLFRKDSRSRVLALFYFAIPVGTGMGYIIGNTSMHFGCTWFFQFFDFILLAPPKVMMSYNLPFNLANALSKSEQYNNIFWIMHMLG